MDWNVRWSVQSKSRSPPGPTVLLRKPSLIRNERLGEPKELNQGILALRPHFCFYIRLSGCVNLEFSICTVHLAKTTPHPIRFRMTFLTILVAVRGPEIFPFHIYFDCGAFSPLRLLSSPVTGTMINAEDK